MISTKGCFPVVFNGRESIYEVFEEVSDDKRYGSALRKQELSREIAAMYRQLTSIDPIKTLLVEIKQLDYFTYIHMVDTFILGAAFAKHMDFPRQLEFVKGCLMHDIGKLLIRPAVLRKRGKLSSEEFNEMKAHTVKGEEILTCFNETENVAFLAKEHHERLDGSGYPLGFSGSFLSQETRAMMMIDVYSAMTLDRPYRSALSCNEALRFLLQSREQFDYGLLIHFMEMLHIFPEDSVVCLSDGRLATVEKVPEDLPIFPEVKILSSQTVNKLEDSGSLLISHFHSSNAI